jgi:hypothetical protein
MITLKKIQREQHAKPTISVIAYAKASSRLEEPSSIVFRIDCTDGIKTLMAKWTDDLIS